MGGSLFGDPFYTMDPYHNILKLPVDFDLNQYDWSEVMCLVVESCPYVDALRPHTEEFWKKVSQIQEQGVIIIIDDGVSIIENTFVNRVEKDKADILSLIHISEPTRLLSISYAVFCLKKKTRDKYYKK